jgi:hypothetical protein
MTKKLAFFYVLQTRPRTKLKSTSFTLWYEHPPYLKDYGETAPLEAQKHTFVNNSQDLLQLGHWMLH